MKPLLALSTSWNSHRHRDGYEMLAEIAELGFRYAELSHGIRLTLVPGILRAVEAGVVAISSTHNFCPLPTGVNRAAPNLHQPSASDHGERAQWLRHTRRSIEFAAQVKAQVLVCHLGSIEFFWFNPVGKVRRHLRAHPAASGAPDNATYRALLGKVIAKLRKRMPPYWANVKACLGEVLEFAREKGVRLGVENREKLDELPLDDDVAGFLAEFAPDAPIGYWHDTGHAELKERMGVLRQAEHLELLSPRLLGFHLHDVSARGLDHQAVGEGAIDFQMVSRFWRPGQALTLELSPRVSVEQVRNSKARIEALMR